MKLVASIRHYYPRADVLIVDNGHPSETIDGCETVQVAFDLGLSFCRNLLAEYAVQRQVDLLVLDDDYEFTSETRIESLQEVLAEYPDIGVCCGNAGTIAEPKEDQITSTGLPFQIVGIADNFMVVRREALDAGLRWDDRLKVREHRDFFDRVAASGWRAARVPSCRIRHNRYGDSPEYDRYRYRSFG